MNKKRNAEMNFHYQTVQTGKILLGEVTGRTYKLLREEEPVEEKYLAAKYNEV
jgi:hypothetical protein